MPEIFISYRREDSSGHAGRIFDCMRERFGDESVFMDVTDIQPGVDFTEALDTALSSCRVVLVVIGTQWLTSADSSGRRRLDDPGDHLRLEIAGALARGAHVIPVLVRGAAMPREQELPDDLRPLARRQAHEVSDTRWSFDTGQLVRIVESRLGSTGRGDGRTRDSRPTTPDGAAVPAPERSRNRVVVPAFFLVVLGLIAVGTWWANSERTGTATQPFSGGAGAATPASSEPAVPAGARRTERPESLAARLPASGEVRAGDATFKVIGGLVNRDAAGQTVRLYVRIVNVAALYGFVIAGDSFRLIVEGQPTAPTESPVVASSMQSAVEGWVVFKVASNARAVVLQVGDIKQATAKIPIDLGAAETGGNEKPAPAWRYPVDLPLTLEKRIGPLVFSLNGARLEHFADAVPPLQPEQLLLSFKVTIKNVGSQYGHAVVGSGLFRLLVDDVPLAPTKGPIEALAFQASLGGDVVFVMPGTATKAFLQVGALDGEKAKVPIDLSPAR